LQFRINLSRRSSNEERLLVLLSFRGKQNYDTSELPNVEIGTSYRDRLYPWSIVCLLPNMQRSTVSRTRTQAEEHLKALYRFNRSFQYTIVFDPERE